MHTKSVLLSSIGLLSLIFACDYGAVESTDEPALEIAPAADDWHVSATYSEVIVRSNRAPEKVFLVTQRKDREPAAADRRFLPRQEPGKLLDGAVQRGERFFRVPAGEIWFASEDKLRVYVAISSATGVSRSSSRSQGGRSQTFDMQSTTIYVDIPSEPTYDFTPPPPPPEQTEAEVEQLPRPAERPNWQGSRPWPGEFRTWGQPVKEPRGAQGEEQQQTRPAERSPQQPAVQRRSGDTTEQEPPRKGVWVEQPDGSLLLVPERKSPSPPPPPRKTY